MLEDYVHLVPKASDEFVDVHANQVALLSRSKCFTSSPMTCTTCYVVHRPQREGIIGFFKGAGCGTAPVVAPAISVHRPA